MDESWEAVKMRKRFNITGSCKPQKHYMVNLADRIKRIKEEYVDEGSYFVINRGRQYGKTTTLQVLGKYLAKEYIVFSLDFQKMATKKFTDETTFTNAFVEKLFIALKDADTNEEKWIKEQLLDFKNSHIDFEMDELFTFLSNLCEASPRPIILMIDEVDSASNNQVFLDFLAQLRGYYLEREETPIFHSVILAGVYDIKNLKLKLRPESEHQYNSPWNIAAKFKIEMHFLPEQIARMLEEYEADYPIGMDIQAVAKEIYAYTSGYPVLVSSICKCIDEDLPEEKEFETPQMAWTKQGVAKAVKNILKESTPLFESMVKQLDIYKDLQAIIEGILYRGMRIPFEVDVNPINIGKMFGFLKEVNGQVAIANRMFEMELLNIFITKEALNSESYRYGEGNPYGGKMIIEAVV